MADDFNYWAFISYSHADAQWANWLHRKLESYRTPSRLVGRPSRDGAVPKRLYPIFRDREELSSSSDLGTVINEALRSSRYQIVICSPRSAASKWVNEEIRHFKSMGKGDRILCLIVDGEPNADSKPGLQALECFAPALRYNVTRDGQITDEPAHPVAADARAHADGKDNARLKLIAGLLDVGLDDLRQREQRRRIQVLAVAVGASLSIAAATSVLAVNAYHARNEARQQTERVKRTKDFFVSIFTNVNPLRRQDSAPLTVTEALDAALKDVNTNLSSDPRLQASLLTDFGEIRAGQGDAAAAKKLFQQAVAIQEKTLAPDDPALGLSLLDLGSVEGYLGNAPLGIPALKRAVSILEKQPEANANDLNVALGGLANAQAEEGDLDEAFAVALRVIALDESIMSADKSPERKEQHVANLSNAGVMLFQLRRFAEAKSYFDQCVAFSEKNFGKASANTLACLDGLTRVSAATGHHDEEASNAEYSLAVAQKSYTAENMFVARAMLRLGHARLYQQRRKEGEDLLRRALTMFEHLGDSYAWGQSDALDALALSRLAAGDTSEALALADRGIAMCQHRVSNDFPADCVAFKSTREKALARMHQGVVSNKSS